MRLVKAGTLRILDLDIESRPLSYLGNDFTTTDITAIAAGWDDEKGVEVWFQTKNDRSRVRMLKSFVRLYDAADICTGHYLLRFDLPRISGALVEVGLPPLGPKLVCDTYVHLIGFAGISKSQGNLAEMFGIPAPKIPMSTPQWRQANRLTPEGVNLTIERVQADVIQHRLLRKELIKRKLLRPPTRWSG